MANRLMELFQFLSKESKYLIVIFAAARCKHSHLVSDDAKCFRLLDMEINPQFVDKCAAQIHFLYEKKEGKLVIEKQDFFCCKNMLLKHTVLILIVISCFFSHLSVFVSPFVGQLLL